MLELGVVDDDNYTMKWSSKPMSICSWNINGAGFGMVLSSVACRQHGRKKECSVCDSWLQVLASLPHLVWHKKS
jgi:hypothetical protein